MLEIVGVTTAEELEAVPADEILAAQGKLMARGARLDLQFQPVVDGKVLPDLPLKTIASGATGNVPTMIGTTLDEMTLVPRARARRRRARRRRRSTGR